MFKESLEDKPIENSQKALSVSELTNQIKDCLVSLTHFSFYVEGEITSITLHGSGHLYFDLKDSKSTSNTTAPKIKGIMFNAKKQLNKIPVNGDRIIACGSLGIYAPQSKYQIIAKSIQPFGIGNLWAEFEKLKNKLKEKGMFDEIHKKPLPSFPKTIGVVTSPTGAVIKDIINVLKSYKVGFKLILNPVNVQGKDSAPEIAQAIKQFNEHKLADVLIVGRGGGSPEDLWAFNEEIVANAIFESEIPIISAVGHQTDWSISDMVADIRAATPSAAAQIVIEKTKMLADQIPLERTKTISLLKNVLNIKTELFKKNLLYLRSHEYVLSSFWQKHDDVKNKFINSVKDKHKLIRNKILEVKKYTLLLRPKQIINNAKNEIIQFKFKLTSYLNNLFKNKEQRKDHIKIQISAMQPLILNNQKNKLIYLKQQINLLNPKNILKKGYTMLFSINKKSAIMSALEVKENDKIKAIMHDGEVVMTVNSTKEINHE